MRTVAPWGAARLRACRVRCGVVGRRLAAVVQEFGGGIEPIRPDDGASLGVHADLAEVLAVAQLLAERAVQQERAVDVPDHAVVERHAQAVAVKRLDVGHLEHAHMLRQRLDRVERLQRLRESPILREFVGMQARPLTNQ